MASPRTLRANGTLFTAIRMARGMSRSRVLAIATELKRKHPAHFTTLSLSTLRRIEVVSGLRAPVPCLSLSLLRQPRPGRYGHGGMEIEAFEVGVQRAGRGDLDGVEISPDAHYRSSGAWPGGDATGHRGTLDLGIHRTFEESLVGSLHLIARLFQIDSVPLHQADDPPAHGR
jgi:hypothetical protein